MEKYLAHTTASELKAKITQDQTFGMNLVYARSVARNQEEELISLSMDSQTLIPREENANVGYRTKLLCHVDIQYDQITSQLSKQAGTFSG